jgi:hypothetical protein
MASGTAVASSRPRKAARAFRSLVLMLSPEAGTGVPHGNQSICAGAEPGDTVGFDTRDAADLHYTPRDRR